MARFARRCEGTVHERSSTGGMRYRGSVRSIRYDRDLGELFELGSSVDAGHRRLVYVTDRRVQIREVAAEE
jgi:hypothetical protein